MTAGDLKETQSEGARLYLCMEQRSSSLPARLRSKMGSFAYRAAQTSTHQFKHIFLPFPHGFPFYLICKQRIPPDSVVDCLKCNTFRAPPRLNLCGESQVKCRKWLWLAFTPAVPFLQRGMFPASASYCSDNRDNYSEINKGLTFI